MPSSAPPPPSEPDETFYGQIYATRAEAVLLGRLGGEQGLVKIAGGLMTWDGDDGRRWSTPLTAVTILGRDTLFSFAGPVLDLEIAGRDPLLLMASSRPMRRSVKRGIAFGEDDAGRRLTERLVRGGAVERG